MTLNKKERYLMTVIYNEAATTGGCLLKAEDILSKIPYKYDFKETDLEPTLSALRIEGYFDYEVVNKNEETVYVIALKEKGFAYLRDKKKARKNLYSKIIIAVICAILGYLVKVIISAII